METLLSNKPTITKDSSGWSAESLITNVNGYDWQILTFKSGSYVISKALPGKHSNRGTMSSFAMDSLLGPNDKSVELIKTAVNKATEQIISSEHQKALTKFDRLKDLDQLPYNTTAVDQENSHPDAYLIQKGQILFHEGLNDNAGRMAIYKIDDSGSVTHYHVVDLDNLTLDIKSRIRPIEEKFGIGTYYRKGDMVDIQTVDLAVQEALQLKAEKDRKDKLDEELQQNIKLQKIEKGKTLVKIPKGTKAIIVANFIEDNSDLQSDYHSKVTKETYYLAFSTHTKDLFNEMRKASANSDITKHLVDAPKEMENRHKYSMGDGYYLGDRWEGLRVRKWVTDLSSEHDKNLLYIAAAEGRYFCNSLNVDVEGAEEKTTISSNNDDLDIQLIPYSEKAFALAGDTKPVKDIIKSLGGKFNNRLTHPDTGNKFAGWIFSNTKLENVKQKLNL